MGWISGVAIYFVIWWTALFVVLPLGHRSQADEQEVVLGTTDSAPAQLRMGRKLMQTTLLATLVFAVFYIITQVFGVTADDFPRMIP